jgi:hypothetical protein
LKNGPNSHAPNKTGACEGNRSGHSAVSGWGAGLAPKRVATGRGSAAPVCDMNMVHDILEVRRVLNNLEQWFFSLADPAILAALRKERA